MLPFVIEAVLFASRLLIDREEGNSFRKTKAMKTPNDEAEAARLSTDSDSFSSDLVAGNKLLTREEECTLKTALAFVVIKARARAKSTAESLLGEATTDTTTGQKSPPMPKAYDSSILDHLFCNDSNQMSPTKKRSLDCSGDQMHVEYMFRAAKTLAETWLIAHNQSGLPQRELERTSSSLQGATMHLAHQLQLLLLTNANQRNEDSRGKIRRPSLSSSKSVNDSTTTPLSYSRTPNARAGPVFLVTPATQSQSITNDDHSIQHETNEIDDSIFIVQDWIRSTLLGQYSEAKDSSTIFLNECTSIMDIQSSFQVYTVMIPQIAGISPPLIGHIFHIVAGLVMDLYSDNILLMSEDNNSQELLDHLATSALGLLELCWTTEITIGENSDRENHRAFLLLSLQEILGELLVPLSRQDLASEHYRLTLSAASLQSAFENQGHRDGFMDSQRSRPSKRQREQEWNESFKMQIPQTLDPEAKLLLRMAVYRLITLTTNT